MLALLRTLFASFALFLVISPAHAEYPERSIRLLVGFPPGGIADNTARIVARALSESLGQSVYVENRAGADSAIAAEVASKAKPDGYTLFFGTASAMAAAPALRKAPPYDPVTGFSHISLIGHGAFFLFVHPSVPANSVSELISYARANPGRLNYGTGNPIAIIATAQLMHATGIRMTHIPYKGEAPAMPDFLAGRVQVMFYTTVNIALPYVKEGKLRVLGVLLDKRSALLPDVPTMAEAGVPEVSTGSWGGLWGPPGMPREIVQRLSRAANEFLKRPDAREQLGFQGYDPQGSTPEELAAFVKDQYEIWTRTVRENGIEQE